MDLTPRLRFQENKDYTASHKELVASDRFRAASEAALVQTILSFPETNDINEAASNWHRIEGARAYLRTLLNIAESAPLAPTKPNQNLTR